MNPKAISVVPLEGYKLLITFSNGEIKIFDVEPFLKDKFWAPLAKEFMFSTVKIAGGSIEWDNGVDFCPDELYEKSKKVGKRLDNNQVAV